MAKKVILVSDLGGAEIPENEQVEIRVLEFPELSQPVRLDANRTEADRLKLEAKPLALLELVSSDGTTERIAIDAGQFAKAIKGDAHEVMGKAEGLYIPPPPEPVAPRQRRARGTGTAARAEKIDYTDVQFAGRVKRGIVSEGEKETIRTHFDEVNANLTAAGQRTLDLSNIEHVEKYGLQELAKDRGVTPGVKA